MKKYVEKIEHWKTAKTLEYLNNFLKNHNGIINDNDLFDPITDTMRECDWEEKIHENFPKSTISRMEKYSPRRDRLDFDDSPAEILREIWSISFARKRCRTMLQNEIKQILSEFSSKNLSGETFPRKLQEMQNTFALSDFEIEVLTVLALVSNDRLTMIDDHNRRSDENDKAVFVAKCLDCDVSEVISALDCKAKLRRYNCVDSDVDFCHHLIKVTTEFVDSDLLAC